MGSVDDTPSLVYPPPLDPERPDGSTPSLVYPPPLDPARPTGELRNGPTDDSGSEPATIELSTPILVVGGGPVGMMTALLLSRLHSLPTILLERNPTTTPFPKMEYTNGRSMEIYRVALGLAASLRATATTSVPESAANDELIFTSLLPTKGRLLHRWAHDGAAAQREKSRRVNDGSQYLEPHMRCHQIEVERWLKEQVEREERVRAFWGVGFVGLREKAAAPEEEGGKDDGEMGMVSEAVRTSDGARIRVRSKYVIGCDGGGSWVRKSVGLESKRTYLELTMAFAHFRSAALRASLDAQFPRFWHANMVGGGILVSQNEDDLWTAHYMVPPPPAAAAAGGEEATTTAATAATAAAAAAVAMPAEEIIRRAVEGCQGEGEGGGVGIGAGPVVDEVYCKGMWKVEVAIAEAFRSRVHRGRVFLVGDAAHQLSPVGGHGLNSGIGDAFDLAWKIAAVERGWGGERLLESYDAERRQVAFENLVHVQQALLEVGMPMFGAHAKYGVDVLVGEGEESEAARRELGEVLEGGRWLHDQNGNILGVRYKDSGVVVEDGETGEVPASTNDVYVPSTWPGARAPHVWMQGGGSTLDELNVTGFSIVDFSPDGELSRPFTAAAEKLAVPLKVLRWHGEDHVRKIYERDLVLIRPDMYVAWRGKPGDSHSVGDEYARRV